VQANKRNTKDQWKILSGDRSGPCPSQTKATDSQHRTKTKKPKNLADRPSEKPRPGDRTNTETVVQADLIDTQDYQKILIPKRQIPVLCKNFIQSYYAITIRMQNNHPR
jgi:hypothetical protein